MDCGESMYIVTPKYVLCIPRKKMSYATYMNGKISSYKMKPYDYGHTWYEILTGSGTINGDMEEYE